MRCTLTSTNGGSEVTSEVQRLHALVQAGAGNAGQVIAKGFGAGQVLVDGLRALRSGQLRAAQVFVYLQQLGAQVLCLLNCDNLS